MAERRCFSRKVVESDDFRALSDSCQALYLHLNMAADDDGFLNGAGAIASMSPRGAVSLKQLVDAGFLLKFGNIYVIKHWKISNSLKADRIKPLLFPDIAAKIYVKSNRAYSLRAENGEKSLLEVKNGARLDSQPNRTEQKRIEPNTTEARRDFEALLAAYPEVRRGKDGWEAFCRNIRSRSDFSKAMKNLEIWKKSDQWHKNDGQYIPNLENFLDRGCWKAAPAGDTNHPSGVLGEAELEAIAKILEEET